LQAEEETRVGLDEIAEQAEGHVANHEEFEGVAGEETGVEGNVGMLRERHDCALRGHAFAQDGNLLEGAIEERNEQQEENDFIELSGVTRKAVSEVDSPGQCCGRAIGVVGEAGEETADASDGDAESERNGVEISGGCAETDVALGEFDGEKPAG
jgi:hypothetical protein